MDSEKVIEESATSAGEEVAEESGNRESTVVLVQYNGKGETIPPEVIQSAPETVPRNLTLPNTSPVSNQLFFATHPLEHSRYILTPTMKSGFFPSPPSYMSELSEEQKFSRENFRGLIKIRENRESFLTVKLIVYGISSFLGL